MKKPVGKTKEELALEKKRELEKRLQDVSGQLNSTKKPPKKGECWVRVRIAGGIFFGGEEEGGALRPRRC